MILIYYMRAIDYRARSYLGIHVNHSSVLLNYGNNYISPFFEKGKYEIRNISFTLRKESALIKDKL